MSNAKEFSRNLKDLIELHPSGTTFCITSKESGFVLNVEDLNSFLTSYDKAVDALKDIGALDIAGDTLKVPVSINSVVMKTLKELGEL